MGDRTLARVVDQSNERGLSRLHRSVNSSSTQRFYAARRAFKFIETYLQDETQPVAKRADVAIKFLELHLKEIPILNDYSQNLHLTAHGQANGGNVHRAALDNLVESFRSAIDREEQKFPEEVEVTPV